VKVGDLIEATGPCAPDTAIIIEFINEWIIRYIWSDNGEIDCSSKDGFKVINE